MTTQNSAKTPEELQGANAALGRKVAALEIEVRLLREMLALARLDRFGPKSEKTPHEQQAGLFNEVEATADVNVPEPETQTVTSYARRKTRGPCTIDLNTLPQEEIVHDLPEEEQVCPACARALHGMGEVVRREIKIIPARMVVVNHVRKKYTCRHCQDNALRTPVLTAPMPSPAFPGSMASASCVAFIIGQKFLDAMPLYRQEKQWARNGVLISRQTMANWVIKGADWLLPIYEKLHRHLLLCAIVKADETCVQVLHEDGRRAQAQSYMWVFRNGRDGPAIVFYCYRPTRAGENAAQCLAGFKGFLQTDGYAGYNLVAG